MFRYATHTLLARAIRQGLASRSTRIALLGATSAVGVFSYSRHASKSVHLDSYQNTLPPLEQSEVKDAHVSIDETLRSHSSKLETAPGISAVYLGALPSNNPSEDYSVRSSVTLPSGKRLDFFGVFDGHNGFHTSQYLAKHLVPFVARFLEQLYDPSQTEGTVPTADDDAMHAAIRAGFLALDEAVVDAPLAHIFSSPSKAAAVAALREAASGSCALLAMHDAGARRLHVALAGDSRAVLGRRRRSAWGTVSYDVHVLTQDHNGHNPAEVERLTPLHPGEALFANGRFVGWGPSRSFGNGKYKWDLETLTRLREGYLGGSIPPTIKTPPYFTAEPVVTTIDVQPGDFVVLASDGLWDVLTNAEVIGLVGLWLRRKHASYDRPVNRRALPATAMDEDTTQQYPWWRAAKRFVCVDDDNPATHLMRNALGGADKDLAEALLRLRGPLTRRFRDDITAMVILFDG